MRKVRAGIGRYGARRGIARGMNSRATFTKSAFADWGRSQSAQADFVRIARGFSLRAMLGGRCTVVVRPGNKFPGRVDEVRCPVAGDARGINSRATVTKSASAGWLRPQSAQADFVRIARGFNRRAISPGRCRALSRRARSFAGIGVAHVPPGNTWWRDWVQRRAPHAHPVMADQAFGDVQAPHPPRCLLLLQWGRWRQGGRRLSRGR